MLPEITESTAEDPSIATLPVEEDAVDASMRGTAGDESLRARLSHVLANCVLVCTTNHTNTRPVYQLATIK
jgi:hypothetical protein